MPEMELIAAASQEKLKYEIIRLAKSEADDCGILKPNPKPFFFSLFRCSTHQAREGRANNI